MENYAKSKMELAPRDIVSRAIISEIREGRGFKDHESGFGYVHLDLRHLDSKKIDERLPMIKEITMKMLGIDPGKAPIPVRPATHFTMGGIHTDIKGRVMKNRSHYMEGVWAAGECGCVSVHGSNRLGSNSLSQCSVWGRLTGEEAAANAQRKGKMPSGKFVALAEREEARVLDIAERKGHQNPYALRDSLYEVMDEHLYVFRTLSGMRFALKKITELRKKAGDMYIADKGTTYNTNLREAFEIVNLLDIAWIIAEGALRRHESRGAHVVKEYPKRDDKHWLKHTIAIKSLGRIRFEYLPVKIRGWQPEERKY
jgi:succinate dehydrogenase / fumarate reductase flavoprotein subunit